jgi:hypothetical protein
MTLDEIGQQLTDLREDIARNMAPEVMTTEQAADFLHVTTETLFRWRKDASGPPYSQPSRSVVRYLKDDLIAWMREHQT